MSLLDFAQSQGLGQEQMGSCAMQSWEVAQAAFCETQLLHPSPQSCFQASTFKLLPLCT